MTDGISLPGRVLALTGVELAPLLPEQSYLILLQAV